MRARHWLLAAACLTLAACGATVERRPLATGQAERLAYELQGADLSTLHQEARRLCPTGVDIIREASQGTVLVEQPSAWRQWLSEAGSRFDGSVTAMAQLVVVCRAATATPMSRLGRT